MSIKILKELALQENRRKYPNFPEHARPQPKYSDKNSNGLTKCIIDFLNFSGCQAERISIQGRFVDNRETYTDVVGFRRQIGSTKWIKGQMTAGTADISSTIAGKSVKIEVKVGKDRMREAQWKYKQQVERAGGIYIIAKTFDQFYQDITTLFPELKNPESATNSG